MTETALYGMRIKDMPWGLFALAAGMCVGWLIRKREYSRMTEFDERQEETRNTAFRRAWITAAAYETVYVFLNACGIRFADDVAGPVLGVMLSYAVFHFTAFARDAVFPFRDRSDTAVHWALWIVVGMLWIGLFALRAKRRGDFTHGIITAGMLELFAGLLFTAVGAAGLVRLIRRRKDNGDGDGR